MDGTRDSDGDATSDGWEILHWQNPWTPTPLQIQTYEQEPSPFEDFKNSISPPDDGTGSNAAAVGTANGRGGTTITTPRAPVWQRLGANPVSGTSTYRPDQVLIEWENDSEDLAGTEIWRGELKPAKTESKTEWTKYNAPAVARHTVQSWVDTGVKGGHFYIYRVRPWNLAGYAFEEPSKLLHMRYLVPLVKQVWMSQASKSMMMPGCRQFLPPTDARVKHYLQRKLECPDYEYSLSQYTETWWPISPNGRHTSSFKRNENDSITQLCITFPTTYPPAISDYPDYYYSTVGKYFLKTESFDSYYSGVTLVSKSDWTRRIHADSDLEENLSPRYTHNGALYYAVWNGSETWVEDYIPATSNPTRTSPWSGIVGDTLRPQSGEYLDSETATQRHFTFYNAYGRVTESYGRTETFSNEYPVMTFVSDVSSRAIFDLIYHAYPLASSYFPYVRSFLSLDAKREDLGFNKANYYIETYPTDDSMPLIFVRNRWRRNGADAWGWVKPLRDDYGHLSARVGTAETVAVFEDDVSGGRTPERTVDPLDATDLATFINATPGAVTQQDEVTVPNVSIWAAAGYSHPLVFGCADAGNPDTRNMNDIAGYNKFWGSSLKNPYFAPEAIRGAIVPYNEVTDPNVVGPDGNRVVQDFTAYLDITDVDPSVTWGTVNAPYISGAFSTTPIPERAIFQNPKKGGLYKFKVSVSGVNTGVNLVLPLAGADVLDWLKTETPYVKAMAASQKKEFNRMAELIGILLGPGAAETWRLQVYGQIGAIGFDYRLDPVNQAEGSPTPEFQRFKPWAYIYAQTMVDYPCATVNGVAVEGTRVNYLLLGAYFRAAGFRREFIKTMGDANQRNRSGHPDSDAAHATLDAAFDIVDNPSTPVEDILTHTRVLSMQDSQAFNAKFYWPASQQANQSESWFGRPLLFDPLGSNEFLKAVKLDVTTVLSNNL